MALQLAGIDARLSILTWMVATSVALSLGVLCDCCRTERAAQKSILSLAAMTHGKPVIASRRLAAWRSGATRRALAMRRLIASWAATRSGQKRKII